MFTDIITIARKELKEIFVQRGSIRAGLTNLLLIVGIFGIIYPQMMGRQWVTSPIGLVAVIWMPMFLSMSLIADAIAGERERHTLETLLASRLSDQAILYGKVSAAVLYCFIITLAILLVGAGTVNVTHPGAGFYNPAMFFGALIFALLGAGLVSGIGVLVSLHASNVRQAYQRMSIGFMVLWLPLLFAPQLLPREWQARAIQWAQNADGRQIALIALIVLLMIDFVLIRAGVARFKRATLILD
jgi:ABC-2 type transport system permease protein